MSDIFLVANICCYNEVEKGNLDRCLDNVRQYCDEVIVYDDGSTDNSVAVAESYGCRVIQGQINNQMEELAHKQILLDAAINAGATHVWWIDCDEVLGRDGTEGGLRKLCENWPAGLDAYSFRELNLWRSQTWVRTDTLFSKARFVRLWRVRTGMRFDVRPGVHLRLFPSCIDDVAEAPFGVIHYGFWDYPRMMVKIGAHLMSAEELRRCAETNWILDERHCASYRLADDRFPRGCMPPDIWEKPAPRAIEDLLPYSALPPTREREPIRVLADVNAERQWEEIHAMGYHPSAENIEKLHRQIWDEHRLSPTKRSSLFEFDPSGLRVWDWGCGAGDKMLDCIINGAGEVCGFDVNPGLLQTIGESFQKIGVPKDRFLLLEANRYTALILSDPDVIYSVALTMHLRYWQVQSFLHLAWEALAPGGELHVQFYDNGDGSFMFNGGLPVHTRRDDVSHVRVENEIRRLGFRIRRSFRMPASLPVWQAYECVKP